MSYHCLSSATILRCAALTKVQNGVIFIPCILQVFTLFLLTLLRGANRWKWLLVAESSAIFILSLIDLLAHALPQARTSLGTFKGFDITLGSLSFVPVLIFCYVLYECARQRCLPLLTPRIKQFTHWCLIFSLPLIIIMNELGSFIGISHRVLDHPSGVPFLAVGFGTGKEKTLWLLFTSLELALLLILQGFTFSYLTYLSIQAIEERRATSEISFPDWSANQRVKGLIWLAIGVKLGLIETILGFVQGGFALIFIRRLLRMLSRVCIYFGVLYSDSPENPARHRRNVSSDQLRNMISAPQSNTFNRLSANASNFYSQRRARGTPAQGSTNAGLSMEEVENVNLRAKRVTVQYDGATAPMLNLRLSDLNMPEPGEIQEKVVRRETLYRAATTKFVDSQQNILYDVQQSDARRGERERSRSGGRGTYEQQPQPPAAAFLRSERVTSSSTLASDSGAELASQFPGIPPRVRARYGGSLSNQLTDDAVYGGGFIYGGIGGGRGSQPRSDGGSLPERGLRPRVVRNSPSQTSISTQRSHKSTPSSGSLRRKAPPPIETSFAGPSVPATTAFSETPATSPTDRGVSHRRTTTASTTTPGLTTEPTTAATPSTGDPFSDNNLMYRESELYNSGRGLGTIAARVLDLEKRRNQQQLENDAAKIFTTAANLRMQEQDPSAYEAVTKSSLEVMQRRESASSSMFDHEDSTTIETAERKRFSLGSAMQRPGMTRIKSIGVVSPRRTPTPSRSEHLRKSMKVNEDDMGDIPTSLPVSQHQSLSASVTSFQMEEGLGSVGSSTFVRPRLERRTDMRTETTADWMV